MIGIATKFAPTAAAYAAAREAGFRRFELWTDAAVLAGWQEVVALAAAAPGEHVLHFPNKLDQLPETLAHAAALYRALGCQTMVIHQPHVDRHGPALLALDPALRLAVENHKLTPGAFRDWAGRNEWLTLDVEHLWKFTLRDAPLTELLAAVGAFLAEFGGKLRHVHLPGYLPGQPEHRPMVCSRDMVLGVLSLLEAARFGGFIVSEVNEEFQNVDDLHMDVLLFRRWRALHGGG
jgi:hypothetical protein